MERDSTESECPKENGQSLGIVDCSSEDDGGVTRKVVDEVN